MSVIHSSRGTTFIRRCPTASTSSSTNILQPANGGIRQRSTLACSDFFSQLRGFIRGQLAYELSTNRSLSRCNREPLLVPSKLLRYSVVRFIDNIADKGQIKTPFILLLYKGRRALYSALVVPPSFVAVLQHQPRRVLTYSSPFTGTSGKGLLSHVAISSRSSRFLFTAY